jgi:hypothetical protein
LALPRIRPVRAAMRLGLAGVRALSSTAAADLVATGFIVLRPSRCRAAIVILNQRAQITFLFLQRNRDCARRVGTHCRHR